MMTIGCMLATLLANINDRRAISAYNVVEIKREILAWNMNEWIENKMCFVDGRQNRKITWRIVFNFTLE